MITRRLARKAFSIAMCLFVGASLCISVLADSTKVEGFIESRSGDTMTIKSSDSTKTVVLLTDSTKVGEVQGAFKVRRKQMSMAALIPGLRVKVEGAYSNNRQLVAEKVSFKGNDLERALAMQAGMHETKIETHKNREELEKQNAAMQQQQQQITAHKAALDAAIARFGQLDDYYILDEVTVRFGNGSTKVQPTYIPQLVALSEKAKGINGYLIEVTGYASTSGSAELNQRLSEDRANAVSNILIQQGGIPLTRMLAPGAMGETRQVGNSETEVGQQANRRVVVRILQNKAIAGL